MGRYKPWIGVQSGACSGHLESLPARVPRFTCAQRYRLAGDSTFGFPFDGHQSVKWLGVFA